MSYYESNTPVWPNTRPGWDRSGATNFQQRLPHASNPADITIRYAAQMKGEEPAFGSQLDGKENIYPISDNFACPCMAEQIQEAGMLTRNVFSIYRGRPRCR